MPYCVQREHSPSQSALAGYAIVNRTRETFHLFRILFSWHAEGDVNDHKGPSGQLGMCLMKLSAYMAGQLQKVKWHHCC